MKFYPKKQKYFKALRVSIAKAIYLNKEESLLKHTLLSDFFFFSQIASARGKDNKAFKY